MQLCSKTLVYKRTHKGDPGDDGVFGTNDCMGQVRGFNFDSVIGVGGNSPDKGHEAIACKVTWVGLAPQVIGYSERGPILKFGQFWRFDEAGPDLKELASRLYEHMFVEKHRRVLLSQNLSEPLKFEVSTIMRWCEDFGSRCKPASLVNDVPTRCKCQALNSD